MSRNFCRVYSVVAVILFILIMTFITVWSVLKPKSPLFRVDSATVTVLNATDPYLTASWNFTLVVTNPSHSLGIEYDAVSATVTYGQDNVLAHMLLPSFTQKRRAETTLQIQFAVVDEFLEKTVAVGLASDQANGSIQFGLTFWALIRLRIDMLQNLSYILKAQCKGLSFAFSPQNGTGALMNRILCV